MEFCRSAVCVLVFLLYLHSAESGKTIPTVRVKFNSTAVLHYNATCSGLVTWIRGANISDILAQCDQRSCRSMKEGYQMIYNQYRQGNFSLIISEADFSNRGTYTCECDGTDLYDVRLQIEPLVTEAQVNPGGSLLMKLDVSDPVEVIYNSSTGAVNGSSGYICRVEKSVPRCTSEYSKRVTFQSSSDLELRGMNVSDNGFYTIRTIWAKQDIHIYNVNVTVHVVKVQYNDTAVLPCNKNCPGEARWIRNYNLSDALAECNQSSCRSVTEGYQMIYNQYLQGYLFLIINNADHSNRGSYTCQCNYTLQYDVWLQVLPLKTQVELKAGDPLRLDLEIMDPVEVFYNGTGKDNRTSVLICTVDGRFPRVSSAYTLRTYLSSAVEVRDMNESDSGVYIVRNISNKEEIHIYDVTIRDYPCPHPGTDPWRYLRPVVAVIVAVTVILALIGLLVKFWKNVRSCWKDKCVPMYQVPRNEDSSKCSAEEEILPAEQQ